MHHVNTQKNEQNTTILTTNHDKTITTTIITTIKSPHKKNNHTKQHKLIKRMNKIDARTKAFVCIMLKNEQHHTHTNHPHTTNQNNDNNNQKIIHKTKQTTQKNTQSDEVNESNRFTNKKHSFVPVSHNEQDDEVRKPRKPRHVVCP